MSTATLDPLDAIEQQTVERKKNAAAAFWRLAQTLARKKKVPPPSEAAEILEDAGKTPSDLREAVALIERRLTLAAQIAKSAAETGAERSELVKRHDAGLAAFQAAQSVFERIRNETWPRLSEIERDEIAAEQARAELARKCPYEPISEQIAQVRDKANILGSRIGELERLAYSNRRDAREHPANKFRSPAKNLETTAHAAELNTEADAIDLQLPQMREEHAALLAEEQRLVKLTLEP